MTTIWCRKETGKSSAAGQRCAQLSHAQLVVTSRTAKRRCFEAGVSLPWRKEKLAGLWRCLRPLEVCGLVFTPLHSPCQELLQMSRFGRLFPAQQVATERSPWTPRTVTARSPQHYRAFNQRCGFAVLVVQSAFIAQDSEQCCYSSPGYDQCWRTL